MKVGSSGKPFTDKNGKFDKEKFFIYKQFSPVLTSLSRDGYGVEIVKNTLFIYAVERCDKTNACSTKTGRLTITDAFKRMTSDKQKERILKTLNKK